MKDNKLLSAAGLGISESNRLKTYCSLMQESLIDRWQIEDEFIDSHVCFIDADFLSNIGDADKAKSQVMVLVTKSDQVDPKFKYQIKLPFTTTNVKEILNNISSNHTFQTIGLDDDSSKNNKTNFASSLLNFGKSLFGDKESNKIDFNKALRIKTNKIITKKLSFSSPKIHQVVFIGSPRSGKTKAIETVCEGKSLSTNFYITDEDISINIDYGECKIESKQIKLVGLPSKVKSNASWNLLTKQANAIVIMLDLSRPDPISYLDYYMNFIKSKNSTCDVFCCFTHCDKNLGSMHQLVLKIKSKHNDLKRIHHIDARDKQSVVKLLSNIYK